MTIWILAVLLLAATAGIGYKQGAIRVACSFLGILLGAALAVPVGHLIRPLLSLAGLKNPFFLWLTAQFIVFFIFSIISKVAGLAVHKKTETFYKYKVNDLHQRLWERLNRRLGLCLGLANGVAYLILISFVIYTLSYWTYQTSSESDSRTIRILNQLGQDSVRTRMARVARAIDKMPATFYDAADVAGLIYHNPTLQSRISRYPAFLSFSERSEFQELGTEIADGWQKQISVKELAESSKAQVILKNPELLHSVWETFAADIPDFSTFLRTGKSEKYDSEKILGRWSFDPGGTLALARKSKPNLPPAEMLKQRRWFNTAFDKAGLVAAPDQQAFLKNIPRIKPGTPPTVEYQIFPGQWKSLGGKYELALNMDGKAQEITVAIEGDRLTLNGAGMDFAFKREVF
jgi:hypothetical protein